MWMIHRLSRDNDYLNENIDFETKKELNKNLYRWVYVLKSSKNEWLSIDWIKYQINQLW